jgi:hypothetical protein
LNTNKDWQNHAYSVYAMKVCCMGDKRKATLSLKPSW